MGGDIAMGKLFFGLKKNNKGVSLVEVMVTIAMVVIIAGPLINSFLNAKGVNSNARVIQNGTIVAQDTIEKFGSLSVEQLSALYSDNLDSDAMSTQPGVYIFKDISVTGANGEAFLVDVTLDANTYADGDDGKPKFNNVKLPAMSSLYGSDSFMLYKYYVAMDEKLKELFNGKISNTNEYENLYGAYRKYLSKKTNIEIICRYDNVKRNYFYNIKLEMIYNYKGTEVKETKAIDDIMYTAEQDHSIYLVCPIFDLCSTDERVGNFYYATDKINIKFINNCDDELKQDLHFYLVEQDANHLNSSTLYRKFKLNNLTIQNEADVTRRLSDSDASEFLEAMNFKLYTNIEGTSDEGAKNGLTYTDKTSGVALYDMTVKVKHKDKTVAEFSVAK